MDVLNGIVCSGQLGLSKYISVKSIFMSFFHSLIHLTSIFELLLSTVTVLTDRGKKEWTRLCSRGGDWQGGANEKETNQ